MNYVERIVARQQKEFKKERYVDYRKEAIICRLKKRELEDRLIWLTESGYRFVKHSTLRENIGSKTYSLCYNSRLIMLSYYDGKKYYWCSTNYHDDTKNIDTPNSFKVFKSMFKKRTGITLLKAFGKTKQLFKLYCPKPLYYASTAFEKAKWYDHICKEDYSSHYPSATTGSLPDAMTAKEVAGYQKPNDEYKFAFYPDTGHVAVFGEFDSHEWIKEVMRYSANVDDRMFKANYLGTDKRTILMKEAQYKIANEIMYFYNIKSNSEKDSTEYNDSKIFLLKFIGMLEQCNSRYYLSYPFAHLAAVIKWRANIKMFKTIKTIGDKNVIQVCVDGIIHAGEPIGTYENSLGSLNIEATDCKFVQRGINQYILKNKVYKEVKHTGLDVNVDSENVMTWMASSKINFIDYMNSKYIMEELK